VIRSSFFQYIDRYIHLSHSKTCLPGSLIKKRTQKESNKNKKPTKRHVKLSKVILLTKKISMLPRSDAIKKILMMRPKMTSKMIKMKMMMTVKMRKSQMKKIKMKKMME